jgi:hypothetical protein
MPKPCWPRRTKSKFDTVTYTYYEQLNGYEYLKQLDIGYFFYSRPYVDDILKVLDPAEKTIIHIPNVNSRESTKDKIKEVEHIIEALGEWQGHRSRDRLSARQDAQRAACCASPIWSMTTRPSATAYPPR